jgi:hypothetical protein
MKILGIYREPECSPGRHRSNDALLLEAVAAEMSARGARVDLMTFDEVSSHRPAVDLVVSMCQGPSALEQLRRWEDAGSVIVNSPRAALNTYRDRLPGILDAAGVRFPATRLMSTAHGDAVPAVDHRQLWLKRGDVHASVPADVQKIQSAAALEQGFADFRERGIRRVALQEHHDGDEIKFYGLADGSFFHWFYTSGVDRDGVDPSALQHLGTCAARAAGLDIFGGDIIIEPSGELTLIDLNDWPSFAPCRDAASPAIASYLARRVDALWNTGLVSSANESAV